MAAKKGRKRGAKPKQSRALVVVAPVEPKERGLPDEVKRRIVTELATFHTPPEVRKMLREDYGLDVSVQDINRYDASKDYCVLGEPLKALFREVRAAFVEGTSELHVANMAYRLRILQRMAARAEQQGNFRLAAALLEQAAKDHGGAFTNKRELSGVFGHVQLSPAQARAEIERYMLEAAAKANPARAPATKH